MSDTELLDYFKLDENHAAFVKNRKDLFNNGEASYIEREYWNYSPYKDTNNHCAWKMHLYSIDELDYQQMAEIVLPYLNEHKITHKTLSSTMSPELLARTSPEQAGKAFTIYPQSKEEMAQIAKDLDKLIREHNLTTNTSHITGDNNLGNSGRLFYRYEFPSGDLKDRIYSPNERAPYEGSRGEGQYLAYDMTPADDPWLNFDPSVPDAEPAKIPSAEYIHVEHNLTLQQFPETGALSKNASYELDMNNLPQFTLANQVTLDLNDPTIKSKIKQLKPGEKLTIGRNGDIQIDDYTNHVSGKHLEIENVNGQIVIRDISTGGTKLANKNNDIKVEIYENGNASRISDNLDNDDWMIDNQYYANELYDDIMDDIL